MTIKQQGGIFGRNPTFNDVDIDNNLTVSGTGEVTGDLGLGKSPAYKLDAIDTSAVVAAISRNGSDGDALQIFNGTGYGTRCLGFGVDGTHGVINNQYGQIQLWTSSAKIATLTATGLAMENGKGIDFSATTDGSGTSTSELLDDYEEGTFQNTIEGGTSAGTCNYVLRLGRYTKIGDQVHFGIQTVFNTHTGTGDFVVGGLPYTVSSANGGLIANVAVYGTSMTFSNQLGARLIPGTTTAKLLDFSSGSSSLTALGIKSSGGIYLSGTYEI